MTQSYRKVVLARPLEGTPQADHFKVVDAEMPQPTDGTFLVEHQCISLDPYQRIAIAGRHQSADGPLADDEAPASATVGRVVLSRHSGFAEGDLVLHQGGWQSHSVSDGTDAHKLDDDDIQPSSYLGVLGMPGLTAYGSIVGLADVQPGQTVLVSAASGPVGATLGQIAIQKGAKAVGIAGSDDKCAYVQDELGFEACINYKHENYLDDLRQALPEGADIYHDNVGGQMLINAFSVLKDFGTVVLCGLISQYNDPAQAINLPPGLIIGKRATVKGLVVYDFDDRYDEFLSLVKPWVAAGDVKFKEDVAEGLDALPAHFAKLMSGQNFGKTIVTL